MSQYMKSNSLNFIGVKNVTEIIGSVFTLAFSDNLVNGEIISVIFLRGIMEENANNGNINSQFYKTAGTSFPIGATLSDTIDNIIAYFETLAELNIFTYENTGDSLIMTDTSLWYSLAATTGGTTSKLTVSEVNNVGVDARMDILTFNNFSNGDTLIWSISSPTVNTTAYMVAKTTPVSPEDFQIGVNEAESWSNYYAQLLINEPSISNLYHKLIGTDIQFQAPDFDSFFTDILHPSGIIPNITEEELPSGEVVVKQSTEKSQFINFDNRLYPDFDYKNKFAIPYCQKYLQTSNLWMQFQSDESSILVELLQDGNVTDISSYASIIKSEQGINWWRIKPIITSYLGKYQIKVTFTDYTYTSEYFQVQESYENISIVKWKGSDEGYGYQDGMEWVEEQEMLIDAEIVAFDLTSEKTVLVDTNNKLININSTPTAEDTLSIYKMPYYLKEKFLLALNHYYFEVNGLEYQTKDIPEIAQMTGSLLYKGEIKLQRVEYEIY